LLLFNGIEMQKIPLFKPLDGVQTEKVTLVEALRYKEKCWRFDSRWHHWDILFTYPFRPHYGPGVDLASNRNEYQEYFLGVEAAGA